MVLHGKRVRGWNLLYKVAADHPDYYGHWIKYGEPRHVHKWLTGPRVTEHAPTIVCLILDQGAPRTQRRTATSVQQAFGDAVFISRAAPTTAGPDDKLIDPRTPLTAFLDHLDPAISWLLALTEGDTVSADLGLLFNHVSREAAAAPIVFWDEDTIRGSRRVDPWLKPQWDPVLARTRNLLAGAALVTVDTLRVEAQRDPAIRCNAEGLNKAFLRVARRDPIKPMHLPLILTHRAHGVPFMPVEQYNVAAAATDVTGVVPDVPSVTIIVPTRDRVDLLTTCLAGLDRIDYAGAIEIIIVDNDSIEIETHRLFDRMKDAGVIVLSYPGAFNFAAMINLAAGEAKGDILCLLNNDIEPLDATWLDEMVRYAVQDGVGAVGARLLYPNGLIQHVGVAAGIGGAAGHVQKGVDPADCRFAEWHSYSRVVSAVTAACLVVRHSVFDAAGGMDAEAFAIDFNDVDLCWRLQRMGFTNVIAVEATLVHRESQTRCADRSPAAAAQFDDELAVLRDRWETRDIDDLNHHPMFRRASERCLLAF